MARSVKRKKKSRNQAVKNPHALALGKLGGKVGGPARAKVLSAQKRRAIASMGARAKNAKYAKSELTD